VLKDEIYGGMVINFIQNKFTANETLKPITLLS
jgi:hypothetical protein